MRANLAFMLWLAALSSMLAGVARDQDARRESQSRNLVLNGSLEEVRENGVAVNWTLAGAGARCVLDDAEGAKADQREAAGSEVHGLGLLEKSGTVGVQKRAPTCGSRGCKLLLRGAGRGLKPVSQASRESHCEWVETCNQQSGDAIPISFNQGTPYLFRLALSTKKVG